MVGQNCTKNCMDTHAGPLSMDRQFSMSLVAVLLPPVRPQSVLVNEVTTTIAPSKFRRGCLLSYRFLFFKGKCSGWGFLSQETGVFFGFDKQ